MLQKQHQINVTKVPKNVTELELRAKESRIKKENECAKCSGYELVEIQTTVVVNRAMDKNAGQYRHAI